MVESGKFVTINNDILIEEIKNILDFSSEETNESNRKKYHDLIMKIYEKWIKDRDVEDVLKNLITNCQCIDWALYLSNKRYRDHYQHQFNVGALGWFLLHTYVSKEQTLGEQIAIQSTRKTNYKWKTEDVHTAWWISSLLHDHGYPIYYLFSVIPTMRTTIMQEFKDLKPVKNSLDKMEESLENGYYELLYHSLSKLLLSSPSSEEAKEGLRIQVRDGLDLLGFSGPIESELRSNIYDHGVLSAINLALKLEEKGDFKSDCVLKEAAKAIALHNNTEIKVEFADEPLAFLLILCDEIQEWSRKMTISDFTSELEQIKLGPFLEKGNSMEFSELLKVKFEYEDAKILRKTNWNYELFMKSKLENFKRLKFSKELKPQKLEFEVRIPSSI